MSLDPRVQAAIDALAMAIADSLYNSDTNPDPTCMEQIYTDIDHVMVEDEVVAAIAKRYSIPS